MKMSEKYLTMIEKSGRRGQEDQAKMEIIYGFYKYCLPFIEQYHDSFNITLVSMILSTLQKGRVVQSEFVNKLMLAHVHQFNTASNIELY